MGSDLLAKVIDYAGLFPPAALSMSDAVAEYLAARSGSSAWMLGRFVVPASRLRELRDTFSTADVRPSDWRVSAIVRDDVEADVAAIQAFNDAETASGSRVDCVECRPQSRERVHALAEWAVAFGSVYVEVAVGSDEDGWLEHVASHGLRAKVRTGGTTVDAFPTPKALAAFLMSTVRYNLAFKATAGLHHAVRGTYGLTYAPDAPMAPMFGYLNVLLATAVLHAGAPLATAEAILQRTDTASLVLTNGNVRWGSDTFPASVLRETRARHLISFGSCSFREPVAELDALAGY